MILKIKTIFYNLPLLQKKNDPEVKNSWFLTNFFRLIKTILLLFRGIEDIICQNAHERKKKIVRIFFFLEEIPFKSIIHSEICIFELLMTRIYGTNYFLIYQHY